MSKIKKLLQKTFNPAVRILLLDQLAHKKAKRRILFAEISRYISMIFMFTATAIYADVGILIYWLMMWTGLLGYLISAIILFARANFVYKNYKADFEIGIKTNPHTLDELKTKRRSEIPYLISNTIHLVLVGRNAFLDGLLNLIGGS